MLDMPAIVFWQVSRLLLHPAEPFDSNHRPAFLLPISPSRDQWNFIFAKEIPSENVPSTESVGKDG